MIKSDQINELAAALAKAQGEFPAIPKNKIVDFLPRDKPRVHYKYADLADIISATTPALSKYGLAVFQDLLYIDKELILETTIMHSSGQFKTGTYPVIMCDKPQEQGAQITYSRRYSLSGALGIQSDEDTDGGAPNDLPPDERSKPKTSGNVPKTTPPQAQPIAAKVATQVQASGVDQNAVLVKPESILTGVVAPAAKDITKKLEELKSAVKRGGWESSHVTSYIKETYAKKLAKELTFEELDHLVKMILIYKPEEVGVGAAPTFDYGNNVK